MRVLKEVIIYTDGASRRNGQPDNIGAWAYTVEIDGETYSDSKALTGVTNNAMEMTACIEALKSLDDYDTHVKIHLDSAYTMNGICDNKGNRNKAWITNWKKNNWMRGRNKDQPVLNKELWQELDELVSKFAKVEWVKIKGHSGNIGNELVDKLANEAMDEYESKKGEWCIEGKSIGDCMNCGEDTYKVSLAFEAPMCTEECDNVQYGEYEEALKGFNDFENEIDNNELF